LGKTLGLQSPKLVGKVYATPRLITLCSSLNYDNRNQFIYGNECWRQS